jgi:DNA repair protein RecN (Recombination protein N)
MLTTLRIKNLALVADLTLELEPGYNVVTGETGAGKSILIGALNLVLGERADRGLIRSGSDACAVEALFDVRRLQAPLAAFLAENGLEPCEGGQLLVKRTFTAAGANRQFINGSPTTLGLLAAVGEWLVDIHGPHEHQSLLHPARQLDMLDAFGKLEAERAAFGELVRGRGALEAEKASLIVDERTYAQQLDLLRHQVREIAAAGLAPEADARIEPEHHRVSNAARLLQLGRAAFEALAESETALLAQAGLVGRTLQELQRVDPAASPLMALHEQAMATLRELQGELTRYVDRVDLDPARLQQLEERLNLLQSLKRKYGSTLEEVISFGEAARQRLESLEARDAELARLEAEIQKLETAIRRAGRALSARRRDLIPPLARAVSEQLADLGFAQSRFGIELQTAGAAEPGAAAAARVSLPGLDRVEFQFAPNPGEPARPLRAIASSGELARVMLALKTVLAAEDQVPVLVFDEVDANIGGETAHTVGEKMQRIARKRQVLCITHLPQVAAPASAHFVASKQVTGGRTISQITRLAPGERVTELARMLGGQSDAARRHAASLLRA